MRPVALWLGAGALAGAMLAACGGGSTPEGAPDAATGADATTADATGGGGGGDGGDAGATDARGPRGDGGRGAREAGGPCPAGMVHVSDYCVDTWEAYVVELDDAGREQPHSPYDVVDGLTVRAKTAAHVVPQGYISQLEATAACDLAGKRLCSQAEFQLACEGPDASNWYPYGGQKDIPGYCNEGKGSYVAILYGSDSSKWTYADFNDPRLNQIDGGLAATESYPHCQSPFGLYDCMGNLHEWGSDPPDSLGHGRFRGGFYGDAELNGPGCLYVTSAHDVSYHDYSTGFRCCADAGM